MAVMSETQLKRDPNGGGAYTPECRWRYWEREFNAEGVAVTVWCRMCKAKGNDVCFGVDRGCYIGGSARRHFHNYHPAEEKSKKEAAREKAEARPVECWLRCGQRFSSQRCANQHVRGSTSNRISQCPEVSKRYNAYGIRDDYRRMERGKRSHSADHLDFIRAATDGSGTHACYIIFNEHDVVVEMGKSSTEVGAKKRIYNKTSQQPGSRGYIYARGLTSQGAYACEAYSQRFFNLGNPQCVNQTSYYETPPSLPEGVTDEKMEQHVLGVIAAIYDEKNLCPRYPDAIALDECLETVYPGRHFADETKDGMLKRMHEIMAMSDSEVRKEYYGTIILHHTVTATPSALNSLSQ